MQDLASFTPRRNRPDRPAAALLHRSQNLMLHPGRQPFQSISIFNQDQAVAASAGTPTPPAADRISGRTGMAGLHREIRARPRNSRLLAPPVTACLDATRRVPMHIGLFLSGGWPAQITDDEERSDDGLQVPDRVVTQKACRVAHCHPIHTRSALLRSARQWICHFVLAEWRLQDRPSSHHIARDAQSPSELFLRSNTIGILHGGTLPVAASQRPDRAKPLRASPLVARSLRQAPIHFGV
jgi:hypothetical protein